MIGAVYYPSICTKSLETKLSYKMPCHITTIPQVKCVTCRLRLNTRLVKICLIEQPSLQNETTLVVEPFHLNVEKMLLVSKYLIDPLQQLLSTKRNSLLYCRRLHRSTQAERQDETICCPQSVFFPPFKARP